MFEAIKFYKTKITLKLDMSRSILQVIKNNQRL